MPDDASGISHRRGTAAASVILLALVPAFATLGLWQLDRAAQRTAEAASVRERLGLPPLVLDGNLVSDESLHYRRAVARGRYIPDDYLLLDGRKQDGRLGNHLVVPLELDGGGRRLLVNRGWRPAGAQPVAAVFGTQAVEGVIIPAPVPALRLPGVLSGRAWPFLDLDRFSDLRGYPVYPFMLVVDPRLASEAVRNALGAEQKWGMHVGYAVQWFAFALIALLTCLGLLYRTRKENR